MHKADNYPSMACPCTGDSSRGHGNSLSCLLMSYDLKIVSRHHFEIEGLASFKSPVLGFVLSRMAHCLIVYCSCLCKHQNGDSWYFQLQPLGPIHPSVRLVPARLLVACVSAPCCICQLGPESFICLELRGCSSSGHGSLNLRCFW